MEVFCEGIYLRSSISVERKAHKAIWLGVGDVHEENRVDLHHSLVGGMHESFQSMPLDRAAFENVPSTIVRPNSAWNVLSGGVCRKPLEILPREGKSLCHGVVSCVSVN